MDALMTKSVMQTPSKWRTLSVTSPMPSRLWPRGVYAFGGIVLVLVLKLNCKKSLL